MKVGRSGILVAGVLAIGALLLIEFSPSAVGEAVYPVERLARFLVRSVRNCASGILSGPFFAAENVRLRREVAALALVREDCARLEKENARLRAALGYEVRSSGEWEAAEVLSSGGAAAVHDTIRVGKGTLSGIREGAVVAVPGGLVGRVSSASPHVAEVELITDPSVRVSCRIETASGRPAYGILMGGGSDRLSLGYLSDAEALRPHARVVTSGLGGVFPKGLDIGTLLLVTNGVRGVEGEVLPCVDCSTLEDVFIRRDR